MSKYHFNDIEAKWQKYWAENQTFKAENNSERPKYYVLDMFPYPSGAGLHVGHPLGYIASDIYARYKRHKGFNVLHPQGYDSFGLPAEQYAIQTGQHPKKTTEENIARYREQLDKIGFSFDWSREVRTSDPNYYKWTQWIFIQLFESWYDTIEDKAKPISELKTLFDSEGNTKVNAVCDSDTELFSAKDWNAFSEEEKQQILLKYRLTYLAETEVNWCPQLGTVLANDEIVNGVSERGGYPVVRKKMKQWSMRITAYAQRLLDGLETIDWPQPLKDSQTNWIGRSKGASVTFNVIPNVTSSAVEKSHTIEVFTTRPDTIFGVSFMTLAPEHDLVSKITTPEQKDEIEAYVEASAKRSERERMADVKTISGVFTGAYAEHPFTGKPIPIWIGDYVLAGYGTGAVMAVPCGDQRDYNFAKHFNIPIPNIFEGVDISEEPFEDKENTIIANSDFINGLNYAEATQKVIEALEAKGQGEGKINYRLRDAVFSRQRYWGEPFPVYYKNGMPQMIGLEHLPLTLPEVEKYLPTEEGEPPLGRAEVWAWDTTKKEVVHNDLIDNKTVFPLELNTMPGWAGSSCYMFRYMDPTNEDVFASKEALDYWGNVDLYLGGSEHATGHLLYTRFWTKFMHDRGYFKVDEPVKKLINQGMILGESAFVNRWEYGISDNEGVSKKKAIFISDDIIKRSIKEEIFISEFNNKTKEIYSNLISFHHGLMLGESIPSRNQFTPIPADVSFVNLQNELDIEAFKNRRPEFKDAIFIKEDNGSFIVSREVEKMSKSKYNVVNPDNICEQYGADTLRMYEMFLGPLEQAKPWNTAGITGVHSFLKKLWKLYHSPFEGGQGDVSEFFVSENPASKDSLKTLHKTIKKVQEDIENFSFNTSVSTFMIAVNELTAQKCNSREVLEPLAVLISPYAPHIAEELWEKLGNEGSISTVPFPAFDAKHLVESSKEYPVSFNGKMRFKLELPLDLTPDQIEEAVMAYDKTQEQLQGRTPKKVIVVPGKIINIVG
ncbi:leucine--tRNA ligase [Aureisphaera sp. CAU 1614]|uniref:Leucine--tRNA ligase n=1 Tax=Halomarinibacterium sedimenti TaxID=2857106 RepID=A0A9X1JZ85_9FLAO|nr:class I tRNA ligase family protein [Halomarinibacterium sedimenti]MBW2937006.1 leucine--tRNA ligase [Halomarinibacterium sedimenti]